MKPNQKNLVSPGDKKRNPNALRRSSQLLYTKRVPPPPPQASASKSAAVVTGQGESLTAPVGDGAGAGGGGSLDANGQQQHQQSHQNNINTNSNGGISHDSGQQRPNQKNTTGEGASKKAEKGKGGTGVGPGLPPQRPPRQRGKLAAAGRGGGGRTSSARYGMGNMSMLSGRSGSVAPVGLSRPGLLYGSLLPTASAKTTMLSTTAADSLMRRQQMRRSFTFPPKSGRRGAGGASSPPPRADGGQWIVPVGGTKGGFLGEEDLFLPPKPEGEGARMRRLLQQVKKPAGESSTSAPQTVAWVSGSFGSVPPKRIRRAASAHAALTGGAAGSAEDKEKDNSPSKKTAKELKVIATTVPRVLYSGFASIPTRHGPIPPPEEEEAHTMSRRLSEDLRSLWSAQPKPAASALSNLQEDAPHSSRLVLHAQEAEEKDTATTGGVPSLPATVAATAGGGGSHPTIPASLSVGSVHSNSHYVSAMPLKNTSNLNVAAATPAARGSAGGAERKKSTSLTGMIQVPSAASISTPALQASNSASAAGIAVGEAQRFGITSLTR